MMNKIKFIVEKHDDGYIAYPLGIQGVVIGEGETSEEALNDAKSALNFLSELVNVDLPLIVSNKI